LATSSLPASQLLSNVSPAALATSSTKTDGVGSFSSADGSRAGGPNAGHFGGGLAAAITTLFSNGESGGRPAAPSSGGVRGAPGPVAGAGLPFLCLFVGIAYVI